MFAANLCLSVACALPQQPVAAGANAFVVRAQRLHTMAGPMIEDGVVVVRDGRIAAVGPAADAPADLPVVRAAVVTPGLIDAHGTVGLSGVLNVPHDQDQLEVSAPIQPELRAIDAYHARDPLVAWSRSLGVTSMHTGHGPGALVSGQTMVVKAHGRSADQDVLEPFSMIAVTLADSGRSGDGKGPGTRAKSVAMLREALLAAKAWSDKRERDENTAMDLRHAAFAEVLAGNVPLLVTAHRAHDLASALRVAEEFSIRVVLDGAAEAYLMLPRIVDSKVWVLPHPAMARTRGDLENGTMELAAKLHQAGVPFAMQTGFEAYVPKSRVLLWETAISVQHGLDAQQALRAMTIDAARVCGVDDRIGSIEVGKHADLALFDGDPFEYTSHCVGTVIDGVRYEDGPR